MVVGRLASARESAEWGLLSWTELGDTAELTHKASHRVALIERDQPSDEAKPHVPSQPAAEGVLGWTALRAPA